MPLVKSLVRYSLIAGLVGGAAVVVAGPDRVLALVTQTRDAINTQIDKAIDDPIAIRAQLRTLEAQYPARIAEVRGDLAELKQQVAQLQRDRDVNTRAAEIAAADLDSLQSMLAKAEAVQSGTNQVLPAGFTSEVAAPIVQIRFNGESLGVDEAYARVEHIQQNASTFGQRVGEIDRDLGYLAQQQERLGQLLTQLETERQSFQGQLWQLDRQCDAIARNDRMIDVMSKRQETIERHSRYRADSLDQVHARLADIRARQEAELDSLAKARQTTSYEDRAKIELDREGRTTETQVGPTPAPARFVPAKPRIINITPDTLKQGPAPAPTAAQAPAASAPHPA